MQRQLIVNGNARLWFRIAQANALDVAPTAKLMAGQVLQVPAALFQAPTWTTAERQATLLAPNAWSVVTRLERPAGYSDLGVKSWENIVLPSMPPKKEQK